jgi:hypothetical protein
MPAPCLSGAETRGARWCSTAPCPLAQNRCATPWPPPGPLGSSASTAGSPGTWRAARWARAGMPWVRGPARARPARPGGPATHDRIDAPTMAVVRRGGLRPQAAGAPAARRATRERRRRRRRMRHRAALWAHRQQTNRPAHPPERGQQRADHAPRVGVAARCPEPAGPQRRAGERARSGHDAARLRAVAPARGRPLRPPGHVGQGLGRQAVWPRRHEARARLSPVGLLRSGPLVPPAHRGGPERARPPGAHTRPGQRRHGGRPAVGARRGFPADTAHGVRSAHVSARAEARRGGARRLTGRRGAEPQERARPCRLAGVAQAQAPSGHCPCALRGDGTSAPARLSRARAGSG